MEGIGSSDLNSPNGDESLLAVSSRETRRKEKKQVPSNASRKFSRNENREMGQ